ncbi:MAG: DNA-binding response regulator, partial [Planctomycetota bacterium]
ESTVDNHKWRLMKKLNVQRTTHLTRLALRAGLIE